LNTVAIVGSNGFIGKKLSSHLESQHYNVKKFDSKTPISSNKDIKSQLSGVTELIWCASRVNPITAKLRKDLVDLELKEWRFFLNTCNSYLEPNQSVIFLSSGGCVYTAGNQFFSEEDEALGINEYGRLKIAMESELAESGLPSKILRVANTYGPNQPYGRGQGVIAEWVNSIISNREIILYGELDSFRDYIFIEDLCFAIQSVIEYRGTEKILNIGTGVATTLQDILDILLKLEGEKISIRKMEARTIDRSGYSLNISRMKKEVGWTPKFSIQSGVFQTLNLTIGSFNN
jgi:UDP-glucose 4-epimerase